MSKTYIKYPSIPLTQAESSVKALVSNAGPGPYTRDLLATGLGYSGISGASSSRIGALSHYALIEKKGDKYQISAIGKRITHPVSDEDLNQARRDAALSPKLFSSLYESLKGSDIPGRLDNVLIQNYSVFHKSAKEAAANFVETMEFAKLVEGSKVLSDPESISTTEPSEAEVSNPSTGAEGKEAGSSNIVAGATSIQLPTGIVIQFPEKLSFALATGAFAESIKELNEKAEGYE